MKIYLIGFMGSGKTTAGKKLAAHLGYRFIDLDDYIEIKEGNTVKEIFETRGEDYFRKTEAAKLREVTSTDENLVISTGGGTPCHFNNMDFMNSSGKTIYLKADSGSIASRLKNSGEKRPLISGKNHEELIEFIENKLAEREVFYSKAEYQISALDLTAIKLSKALGY
ncbi:MAG: hypothetical protein A2W91_14050 [Bacteroidetes bacterium GWF2_38_335]|nr:MAG: hypothetical protein A2W91_14050 [Bacteroidetes bacterium GWF2_38_335]OFY77837.1 MAG: hypothetical protein A2281_15740 [Bacteroidetes bacterium RIFOXYA12_FULL_38_20]